MKRALPFLALASSLFIIPSCKQKAGQPAQAMTQAELAAMADAVPKTGPREGNTYKVFFLALRQDQRAAANFKVDMRVKGKSEFKTVRTNERGLAVFNDLPFPDATHPLETALHYYKGKEDQPREITYPYIDSDAYRLKDVQYIPNTVTSDPE